MREGRAEKRKMAIICMLKGGLLVVVLLPMVLYFQVSRRIGKNECSSADRAEPDTEKLFKAKNISERQEDIQVQCEMKSLEEPCDAKEDKGAESTNKKEAEEAVSKKDGKPI